MTVRPGDAVAPERVWAYDDFIDAGVSPEADLAAGLTSLRFIGTALRSQAKVWLATAMAGLMIGLGLFAVFPPAYQASASIVVTNDPTDEPGDALQTNLILAQTPAVAQGALQQLGLRQSVDSLLAAYTVTGVTDRILLITVNAPSGNEAGRLANALAAEFLRVRADALRTEQQIVLATLREQITAATRQVKFVAEQIAAVSGQPASAARQAGLRRLRSQQYRANVALAGVETTAAEYPVTTTVMVAGSGVLDAAVPVRRPHQAILFYPLAGIFMGLMLGLAIVIVGALASDRLRRRDDVADALGAPVNLSVGRVRAARWLPGRHRLAVARNRDVQRIVAHLRRALPTGSRGAALAVVSVGNAQVAALPLVSLAASCALDGKRVVMADLVGGAPAARLLGIREPGIREASVHGVDVVVAVPDRGDLVPVGPLPPASSRARFGAVTEGLVSAYDSADLLLTLADLDPTLGGEHLATWATDGIVVVAAGRSSPAELYAVGEMMQLAGIRRVSAVLIGTDKADVSLGMTPMPAPRTQSAPVIGISR